MTSKETTSERLRQEARELRETAIDMMEHAALLITKSVEIDKEIAKKTKHDKAHGINPRNGGRAGRSVDVG